MSNPFNVDLSIQHRILYTLTQLSYTKTWERVALPLVTNATFDGATAWTYTRKNQKQWVHLDANGETINTVKVYINGGEANPAAYSVNYAHGAVVFAASPGGTVTVSFQEWSPTVREGYPSRDDLDLLTLPVVAYKIDSVRGRPLAIGFPTKFSTYTGVVDVLASNRGEMLKLSGDLLKFIRYMPILDMTIAQPLGFAGKINPQFAFGRQVITTARWLQEPQISYPDTRRNSTDKERWRAMISFNFELTT